MPTRSPMRPGGDVGRRVEAVLDVRDEDELEEALEEHDPEIFLLARLGDDDHEDPLESVLELLPDVPAGKLAIADVDVPRATRSSRSSGPGSTPCCAPAATSASLVGHAPPDVLSRPRTGTGGGRLPWRREGIRARRRRFGRVRAARRRLRRQRDDGRTVAGRAERRRRSRTAPSRPGWQKLANRIAAAVVLPGLAARSARPRRSAAAGTTSTRSAATAATSRASSGRRREVGRQRGRRRAARQPARLSGCDGDPDLPEGGGDNTPTRASRTRAATYAANGIEATLYTVNQDADQWHLLLAWHHSGSLYTLSEHLAPPLNYRKLVRYLQARAALARADRAVALDVRLTRRGFLAGGAATARRSSRASTSSSTGSPAARRSGPPAALAARAAPARRGADRARRTSVEVLVPPLHHEVVTGARHGRPGDRSATRSTPRRRSSPKLERDYEPTPAGLGVTVAWGGRTSSTSSPTRPGATCRTTGARRYPRCSTTQAVPERPGRHRPRGERPRDPACAATPARTSTTRSSGCGDAGSSSHQPAPRLRRRRVRRAAPRSRSRWR